MCRGMASDRREEEKAQKAKASKASNARQRGEIGEGEVRRAPAQSFCRSWTRRSRIWNES